MFEKQYFASKSQAGNLEEQIEYWRQYLEGAPQYLALPTDWPRPALQSLRSAYQAFTLPAELARQLHQLSQHQGVTLFMTLLAAFQTLLARYTSEEDIIIGAPVSGGAQEEYQSSTGSFANMLPIRVQLSGNPQFSELLERVHATVLDVSMHQKVSLETLFAELQMKRDPSYHPLFQVSFNVRENAQQAFQAANFNSTSIPPGMDTIEVDLAIDILDTGELLSGWIKYSADLFDAQTIARLQGHFKTLLSGIVADPHLRLSQLPILTPSEWQQMLVEWNATETTEPLDRCLYELFEDQVERTPDAIALLSQGESITYTEVNRRANQLAHTLWELGVEPDMLVGILLNRGIDFIVTFLAVFKAGGALLPLDLKQPAKLHAQILSQSKSALLVTHTTLESNVIRILGELPKDEHPQILNIDTLPQPGAWDENMSPCSLPSNLAYVMFTSGSTGIPKGVMVEQRGMLNHIYGKLRDLQIGATDIVAQVGPPCFDIVIWQCLAALLVGGRVCVIPDEIVNDPLLLLDVLVQERITVLQLVPALLRALVQVAQTTHPSLRSLRWIVPTGDALPRELCQSWLHLYPTIPLLNTYGSTECSDDQCHYKIDALPQENAPSVMSIGTPIGNLKTYILDKHLQPVPVGVPGELFIGGIGVGRGYLNRHDLTTERFIPDMFSSIPHARLYHTGDRARYRLDGTIEFLGRLDFMVKIRGLRIELDEIDAVLRKHPHVLDSVVIAQKSDKDDEDARLIAYIVAKPKIKQHTNELRAFLQEYLPEYMIPAIFVPLERLPLGVNGKIDRKALPKPEVEVQESKNTFVAPRNAIEKKLATIWTDVIGVEQIGVYDNFFSLGGHSLLAIQLALSIRSTFQIDLPLRRLFEIPTIAAMAVTLAQQISQKTPDQQGEERFDTKFPEIARVPEQGYEPFPLTDLQQAYWVGQTNFFELGNLSAHTYNEFECLDLDIVVAEQALWKLIARHDMLRAIVRSDGNQQVLDRIPPYKIDLIDLRGLASEEQETHLLEVRERMIQCGPRTDQWPLFELVVHQVADNRFRLHLSLSLLLIDARTERTLAREWLRFYHQPDTLLRPLEMTYRDYLHTLRGIEESEIGLRAWEYWKQRLTTLPAAPELPLLIAPQTLKKSSFVRRRASLEPEVWQRLQALAHRFELTPNIVLCTAYAEIIAKWSKTQHFTLNILSSNRLPLHTQVNEIVGNLSTTIPLEIDCRVLHSFVNRCNTVQAQLWDDIEHSQVSGIRFVREAARTQGWSARAALPIVFASGLDLDATTKLPSYSLAIQEVYSALQTPQVFLDHQVQEVADALMLNWDSIDEIFPAGLIETMFEAYCRLLHRLANDETCWHKPLSLVIGGSHLEHLPHITQAATCDHDGLLHTPFLHRASVFPTHPAVITSRRILSYDELLRRSAQVALWLQQQQVRPNTLVAIVMEKGWEQVVAVLGVLEAGAAYLPIDPSLPPERLHYILEHAEASLALTQSWIDRAVDWPGHVQSRCVDLGEPEADALILPATKQKPEDLAYVIYTSGSTGLPKGVAIDHRGAVNTIADMNQRFHVGPDDRILALSALNFDLSVYDIFGSLAAGATIVFPDVSNLREPAHWADLLLRERVTIWNSVPAFMELLTEHLAQRTQQYPLALRLVLLSGDWIPVSLPDRIRSLVPDVQIISLGGATEASIWSILYPIERVDPQWTSIPYGKGMLNQDIYVLDEALEPRPTWVAGNLYIGGIGLAKGYWRDEEKTRAGFIVHPRAGVPLYRTGDIGRYLPDGNIEFLGREDFQVKIQGYRIELGEIEMALSRHPAVKDVVVTARSSKPNGKILVAYVVPCEDQSLVSVDLRDFLQGILPGYMIPGIFVILQQLPLTANGKIDRRALPDPGQPGSSLPGAFIAPRNAAEAQLVRVWESILDIHPISVTDNFFDLGGNSFSALRLMARLRELWGYELPLSALFQGATIEKMALLFGEQDTPFSLSPLIGMQPLGENTPFFCVHPIGGNVLCYADLVRCLGNGQPFYGLEARDLLYQSIEDMAACYINAIRSVQPHGPYRIGGWSMGGVIAFEMAQQLSQREEEVALLVIMDSELPVVDKSIFELDDADMLLRFISDMHGYRLKDLLLSIAEVRKHTSKSQLLSMLDHMRQASIELPDMESEQFKRLFRIFKSNTYALASYIARPYQHKLTCLQAALGRDGQPIDVSAWQKVAREVEVYQLPGNHYTMFKEPHVKLLARQLQSLLDRSLNLAESRGH